MSTLLLFILITAIIILTPVFKAIFKVGQTVHSFKKAYNEQTKQYQQAKEQQAQTAEINNRKERARAYFKRFREKPLPFYVVNNIIKSAWSWDMRHQDMLAGNLLYIGKKPHRVPTPHDKTVQNFNRISTTDKLESIWKDLYAKPITDIVPGANSPALECGVDVSKDMDFRGLKVKALPGFKPGYFTGKAPAAGAVQPGDEKLMEHFRNLYIKMQNAMEIIKGQR